MPDCSKFTQVVVSSLEPMQIISLRGMFDFTSSMSKRQLSDPKLAMAHVPNTPIQRQTDQT